MIPFRLPAAAFVLALLCAHLSAQVANFNFMEDYNSTNLNFGLGAAPDDSSNNFWNRVGPQSGEHPQDGANFFASDGVTATSIRISFADENFGTGATPLFAQDLFHWRVRTPASRCCR